jgi:Ca2+-binding RTX toxin-like protein
LDVGFGDDTLIAGGGNDYLFGGSGSDVLFGEIGDDTLQGGTGGDTLVGGEGVDIFLYQFKSDLQGANTATTADIITDFQSGEDKLFFDVGVGGFPFNPIGGPSDLIPAQFIVLEEGSYNGAVVNTQATTGIGPVLVYEEASGVLWYDSDGGGANAADIVANFRQPDGAVPTLARTDVVIVLL